MTKVNMPRTLAEFEQLFRMILVEGKSVVVEQDGEPVADITPRERDASRRIGIAKGKFEIPPEFDAWDGEIAGMFGEAE
ncbi:MAG: toxin-antitoxin system antitoxin subunit [Ruminococcaceae bacterium]|nr:toxin-antitoxin system antitoxin subunit [Oscillospiraceae bacterium]